MAPEEPGYTYEAILNGVAGNLDALSAQRSAVRLPDSGKTSPPTSKKITTRAIDFSERLLAEPPNRIPAEALHGLGRWSLALQLDQAKWLDLTERTVRLTGGSIECALEVANRCRDAQPSTIGLGILTEMLGRADRWEQHHIDGVGVEALRGATGAGLAEDSFDGLRERLIQRGRHDAASVLPETDPRADRKGLVPSNERAT